MLIHFIQPVNWQQSKTTKTILEPLTCSRGFTLIFQVTFRLFINTGWQSFLSQVKLPRSRDHSAPVYLLRFSSPAAHKSSYFWERFSYGTGGYAVHKYYFTFSSLNLLSVLKINEIHFMFDILYGLIMHINVHSLLYPAEVLPLVFQICLQLRWWKVKNIPKLPSISLSVVTCTQQDERVPEPRTDLITS